MASMQDREEPESAIEAAAAALDCAEGPFSFSDFLKAVLHPRTVVQVPLLGSSIIAAPAGFGGFTAHAGTVREVCLCHAASCYTHHPLVCLVVFLVSCCAAHRTAGPPQPAPPLGNSLHHLLPSKPMHACRLSMVLKKQFEGLQRNRTCLKDSS